MNYFVLYSTLKSWAFEFLESNFNLGNQILENARHIFIVDIIS